MTEVKNTTNPVGTILNIETPIIDNNKSNVKENEQSLNTNNKITIPRKSKPKKERKKFIQVKKFEKKEDSKKEEKELENNEKEKEKDNELEAFNELDTEFFGNPGKIYKVNKKDLENYTGKNPNVLNSIFKTGDVCWKLKNEEWLTVEQDPRMIEIDAVDAFSDLTKKGMNEFVKIRDAPISSNRTLIYNATPEGYKNFVERGWYFGRSSKELGIPPKILFSVSGDFKQAHVEKCEYGYVVIDGQKITGYKFYFPQSLVLSGPNQVTMNGKDYILVEKSLFMEISKLIKLVNKN